MIEFYSSLSRRGEKTDNQRNAFHREKGYRSMGLRRFRSRSHPGQQFRNRRTVHCATVLLLAGMGMPMMLSQASSTTQAPPSHPAAATLSAEQIASTYYPQEMVDPDGQAGQNYCAVAYENAPDGAPATVLAVYPWGPVGNPGEIWVYQRQSDGDYRGKRIGDPKLALFADNCHISVTDAGPAVGKVIEVALSGNRNSSSFLFRWTGTELAEIGPTFQDSHEDLVEPALTNSGFAPIFPDGTLAVIDGPADPGFDDPFENEFTIYHFDGRTYSPYARGLYMDEFYSCLKPGCTESEGTFSIPRRSTGPYLLRVVNGDASGKNRVAGATIALNGRIVADLPSPVGGKTVIVKQLPRMVAGENKLTVRLKRLPGSSSGLVYVVIEDHTIMK